MKKLNCSFMIVWALLCALLVTPVFATEDGAEDLTLSVEYVYEEASIENADIQLFLVATLVDGDYVLSENFATLDVAFQALTSPSDWREEGEAVAAYIQEEDCESFLSSDTDENGLALFEELAEGVYYVDVTDVAYEDGTLISSPVLISLPSYDYASEVYIDTIIMEPKVVYVKAPDEPTTPTTPTTPDDPTTPETPETPSTPGEPSTPSVEVEEPLIGIYDPEIPLGLLEWLETIPQTGTWVWLALPLALIGLALTGLGLIGLRKKRGES